MAPWTFASVEAVVHPELTGYHLRKLQVSNKALIHQHLVTRTCTQSSYNFDRVEDLCLKHFGQELEILVSRLTGGNALESTYRL